MAMTKKERAEMDAAIERAQILAALRWTGPVERDVDVPKDGYIEGWDYNEYTKRVSLCWTDRVAHDWGPMPADRHQRIGRHGAMRLFSTKARALAAMRHALEKRAAADLLSIDRQIENEMKDSKT